jgi:hypothetical protein
VTRSQFAENPAMPIDLAGLAGLIDTGKKPQFVIATSDG